MEFLAGNVLDGTNGAAHEWLFVTSASQKVLKILSKIVTFDLEKLNFSCPAGAVQRGSVCTLSLIELAPPVSRCSPPPEKGGRDESLNPK